MMESHLRLQRPARRRVERLDRRSSFPDQHIQCRIVLQGGRWRELQRSGEATGLRALDRSAHRGAVPGGRRSAFVGSS